MAAEVRVSERAEPNRSFEHPTDPGMIPPREKREGRREKRLKERYD